MNTHYEILINKLGEVRMGTDGFGVAIILGDKRINALWTEIVYWSGNGKIEPEHELSKDNRYLILTGTFATYIVDLAEMKLSLFRATIRGAAGLWSEENPVYRSETCHLDGKSGKHYYVQFPFLFDKEFAEVWQRYHSLREKQICELRG